eukprot:2328081-Rhodomonas_salina.2
MFSRQQTTKLSMAGSGIRAQKAFALDYCAASFVTEGQFFSDSAQQEKQEEGQTEQSGVQGGKQ